MTRGATGSSSAVNAFVWGGDREALWRALYALDPSGTRMASQYWGVPSTAAEERVGGPEVPARIGAPAAPGARHSRGRQHRASRAPIRGTGGPPPL